MPVGTASVVIHHSYVYCYMTTRNSTAGSQFSTYSSSHCMRLQCMCMPFGAVERHAPDAQASLQAATTCLRCSMPGLLLSICHAASRQTVNPLEVWSPGMPPHQTASVSCSVYWLRSSVMRDSCSFLLYNRCGQWRYRRLMSASKGAWNCDIS